MHHANMRAVVKFTDVTQSPRVDNIKITVLALTSAIEHIRNCNFPGVLVNKWQVGSHTEGERNAARFLVNL